MLDPALYDQPIVPWVIVCTAALVACWVDVRTRRIPNWLTGTLFLAGLVWAIWMRGGTGLLDGMAGCLLLFMPYALLFAIGRGGAGDAKLMAGIGLWLGLHNSIIVLVAVTGCGALLGLGWALSRRRGRRVWINLRRMFHSWVAMLMTRKITGRWEEPVPPAGMTAMPYGLAICCGAFLAAGVAVWW